MALKHFNPTSPGQRGLVLIDRSELHKGKPEKKLVEGLTKSGGRGGNGRIAVRFRGGGAKRLYRLVDFKRRKQGVASVVRLEYDPNRTAFIALIKYQADGELAYILAPQRLKVSDEVVTGEKVDVKPGNASPLRTLPIGTIIHNIELKPGAGGAPKGKHPHAGKPVAPKYRDAVTGSTWSGRGLQPKWVQAAVAAGKTLEDFKI